MRKPNPQHKAAGYDLTVPSLDSHSVLRYVEVDSQVVDVQPYRLLTWDTGTRYDNGCTRIGVAFYLHTDAINDPTLVTYVGLGVGRHADDSDKALVLALKAVCVQPGDTDEEYFADYTPRALAWAESWHCEALGSIPSEAEMARSGCHPEYQWDMPLAWNTNAETGVERLLYTPRHCDEPSGPVFRDLLDW
jgi:hypothetical protein